MSPTKSVASYATREGVVKKMESAMENEMKKFSWCGENVMNEMSESGSSMGEILKIVIGMCDKNVWQESRVPHFM